MRKTFLATLVLVICMYVAIFVPLREVSAVSVPDKVRLFDPKSLYVHGYIVYKYNSSTSGDDVPVSMELWANNFWSDVNVLKTSPRPLGGAYMKYDMEKGEYVQTQKGDRDAFYGALFEFDVQPYQEVKVDVWIKLSVSKVDMSGILPDHVGNVSAAKEAVDPKYLNETYYWDYPNPTVQGVIQEINATIGESQNVYEIVYATINWFSINMLYMEHEDYPHARLKASQILNETILFPSYGVKRYGVCRHFSDAFTAIMRGFGVPCNIFEGLVFYDYGGEVGVLFGGGHAWVEVYLPNVGWVPVDVTISDRYARDIIRVGLVSEIYYLPMYKESTNREPQPTHEFIGAYWGWAVGETPVATLDSIIQVINSASIFDWVLIAIVIVLILDRFMLRDRLKVLTRW